MTPDPVQAGRKLSAGIEERLRFLAACHFGPDAKTFLAAADTIAALQAEQDAEHQGILDACSSVAELQVIAFRILDQKCETERERDEAVEALRVIPPERIRLLADFLDRKYLNDQNPEVQNDLRRMADLSEAALARLTGERP